MRIASAALTSDLDLNAVLQHVVDPAASWSMLAMLALGVLNTEGTEIEQFITAGHSQRNAIRALAPFPRGHGLLGAIIKERRPIRWTTSQRTRGQPAIPAITPICTRFWACR